MDEVDKLIDDLVKDRTDVKIINDVKNYYLTSNLIMYKYIRELLDEILDNRVNIVVKSRQIGMSHFLDSLSYAYSKNGLNVSQLIYSMKNNRFYQLLNANTNIILIDGWSYIYEHYNLDIIKKYPNTKFVIVSTADNPGSILHNIVENNIDNHNVRIFTHNYLISNYDDISIPINNQIKRVEHQREYCCEFVYV